MTMTKGSALALACIVIAGLSLVLWRTSGQAVSPPRGRVAGASKAPVVEEAARAVGESQGERQLVAARTAPSWVVELLYGDGDGIAGYIEAVAAVAGDQQQRRVVSTAVLEELVRDNHGGGRLRNVKLPVVLLTQDLHPAEEVVAEREIYMAQPASSSVHQALMQGLADWPLDTEHAERLLTLARELEQARGAEDLERIMAEMLRLGAIGGRVLIRTMVGEVVRDQSDAPGVRAARRRCRYGSHFPAGLGYCRHAVERR
jgi:hypothetical protein